MKEMFDVVKIMYGTMTDYRPIRKDEAPSEWRKYYIGKKGLAFICKRKGGGFVLRFAECEFKSDEVFIGKLLTTSLGDLFMSDPICTLFTVNSIYEFTCEQEINPEQSDENDPLYPYEFTAVKLLQMM